MTNQQRSTVCDTTKESYKHWTKVELRYGDTDRQGHINNAVYCTLFESGRVAFLLNKNGDTMGTADGKSFMIVKLTLDYLAEMNFPGVAEIGSKITAIGRSSFTCGQAIFKDDVCVSTAESIVVMTDNDTHKSTPLTDEVRSALNELT